MRRRHRSSSGSRAERMPRSHAYLYFGCQPAAPSGMRSKKCQTLQKSSPGENGASEARASSIGILFLLRRFLAGAWDGRRERFAQPLGIHRDLDTRAFLLEQHHRARIAAAPATRESFRHLGEREIAHAHGHAELAAERIGERNVLVGELERE